MSIRSKLSKVLLGASLALPLLNAQKSEAGEFSLLVGNKTSAPGVVGVDITLNNYFNQTNNLYPREPAIHSHVRDESGNQFLDYAVNPNISKSYQMNSEYGSNLPPTIDNYTVAVKNTQAFQFPENMLITLKADFNGSHAFMDINERVANDLPNHNSAFMFLGNSNPVNYQPFRTNWINLSPIDTKITSVTKNSDGKTATLTSSQRPGTVSWPQVSTNSNFSNATSLTNMVKYLGITDQNFEGHDEVTWTNFPLTTTQSGTNSPASGVMHYVRILSTIYNQSTPALLDQSH